MTDLPADARDRIDAARRAAEEELERDIKPLELTTDYLECLPAFVKFFRAIVRSEGAELRTNAADRERLDADLEALLARCVEEIMPDAGLDAARASDASATPPNVMRDNATRTLWEVGADGVLRLATDPAYREQGLWEHFAPAGVKFFVSRSLFKEANAAVRAALELAGRDEKTYCMEQYGLTRSTPLDLLEHIHRELPSWEDVAGQISVASGIKVSRSLLFAWRRAQMGKDPGKPVNAAKAQKIADGIRRVAGELKILPA
jgi:hypothetical protein